MGTNSTLINKFYVGESVKCYYDIYLYINGTKLTQDALIELFDFAYC